MPQNIYIYDPNVPVPKDVRHVEIPKGVTVIREDAFRDCSELQSVTIPDSVTRIGDLAFSRCTGLQSVIIPDGVTEIGLAAFQGCTGLRSVVISGSVTEIGERTFCRCSALQSVVIPDSVTEIGYGAFYGCSGLQSIMIPDSVTKIGEYAFQDCSGLQSIMIPDSVTEIGLSAFRDCSGLRSVTISGRIPEIDHHVFEGCLSLQSVTVPDSIKKISYCAFSGCLELQSFVIPDSVTEIDSCAFYGCGLRSVTIPDGVTKIGYSAFKNCARLRTVRIPDGVTQIDSYAFEHCTSLQSVTIPDSVTQIGRSAFGMCSELLSVTLPDRMTEIGEAAFCYCIRLQSITIPDGITEIGEETFEKCCNLQTVTIPDGVTEIKQSAFKRCDSLRIVTIPDSVAVIDDYAFYDCPRLRTIMFKGAEIAPFIGIDGYGVNTFGIIKTLVEHHVPLHENTVRQSIDLEHRGKLSGWLREYSVFGEMRLPSADRSAGAETKERLRQCFAGQRKTGYCIPKILDELAVTVHACRIPPEHMAKRFDIEYTRTLVLNKIPLVPAEACRCYYNRDICNILIQKNKTAIMAEAISLYNKSGHRECYKYLMDFIRLHPDTRTEDLLYAVDNAAEIPMRADTALAQVRKHRTYMENLAEAAKIEAQYGKIIPGFKLTDYPCSIDPVSITYDGMTARVLDLSDDKDIALAAGLGELTNCCQRLDAAGETAMMHGFLNPDAGFWVIEDKDGNIKAQAEIWKTNNGDLVFANIEFANTDKEHLTDRADRLRGVIAAWAMENGYTNIIMGCGYNELGIGSMEQAPVPELRLTPEEVFALQKDNDAGVFFDDIGDAEEYMQSEEYNPYDFVYTDADEQCVYIKKDGTVSDYLTEGYDRSSVVCHTDGQKTENQNNDCVTPDRNGER